MLSYQSGMPMAGARIDAGVRFDRVRITAGPVGTFGKNGSRYTNPIVFRGEVEVLRVENVSVSASAFYGAAAGYYLQTPGQYRDRTGTRRQAGAALALKIGEVGRNRAVVEFSAMTATIRRYTEKPAVIGLKMQIVPAVSLIIER